MNFTTEHQALSDTVTKFVAKELDPFVPEWEKAEQFPAHEVFKKLGNLGLLGLKYPEEFGGAGLDFSYSMVMAEALGNCGCGGVPMSIGTITSDLLRCTGPSPVLTSMHIQSACRPLVIHILLPSMT